MDDCKYVHCLVIDFQQINWEEGIEDDIIIQHAIDFFGCGVIANTKN